MSISGILSSSFLQNQLSAITSPYKQDMQQLSQDLQSGNLSAAQSDFATLQAAFSQSASTSNPTSNSSASSSATSGTIAQAFNQLASDLKSGNLAGAQKDYTTLQQDLQSQSGTSSHHFHHHHRIGTGDPFGDSSGTGSGDANSQNLLLQDLNQIGQNLTSSNLAGAQAAYANLQQFALGGGTLSSSQTSALLAQPLVSLEV